MFCPAQAGSTVLGPGTAGVVCRCVAWGWMPPGPVVQHSHIITTFHTAPLCLLLYTTRPVLPHDQPTPAGWAFCLSSCHASCLVACSVATPQPSCSCCPCFVSPSNACICYLCSSSPERAATCLRLFDRVLWGVLLGLSWQVAGVLQLVGGGAFTLLGGWCACMCRCFICAVLSFQCNCVQRQLHAQACPAGATR